jgi:hypothetical protein
MVTGTSFIPVIIVIVIVVKNKQIFRKFKDADAVAPYSAKSLKELNLKSSIFFNRFLKRNIIIGNEDDRYYLNENNYFEYTRKRRQIMIIVLAILFLLILTDTFVINNLFQFFK